MVRIADGPPPNGSLQARVLPRQDDECAQLGSFVGEPLAIDQGLGQWLSLQRTDRPSSSEARWWTGSPSRCDRAAWIGSLASLLDASSGESMR
jgi:hypothetical protein